MAKWFVTWNRPEYKEWATEISGGYCLVVLRQEKNKFLCVRPELIMGEIGLPAFNVKEEKYLITEEEGIRQIDNWKNRF